MGDIFDDSAKVTLQVTTDCGMFVARAVGDGDRWFNGATLEEAVGKAVVGALIERAFREQGKAVAAALSLETS